MTDRPLIEWTWIVEHLDDIAFRTVQHLWLAAIAVGVGFVISFGLSLLVVRYRGLYGPITGVSGVLYTIPSLAMFAILVPITGLSLLTAEIPLILYTLLIFVRNIVAGFQAVPRDVIEAADGMGFTRARRLRAIELPLAVPLIITGVRLASVSTIGLVMIVSLIGDNFGGLGLFIKEGIQTFFWTKVYVGTALSLVLAFAVDAVFVAVERAITPWTRKRATASLSVA
jgi:osmoprotectant transport system permease protein